MSIRSLRLSALAVLACLALLPSIAQAGGEAKNPRAGFDQFIVKFKAGSAEHGNASARQRALDAGAKGKGVQATREYRLAAGGDVVHLNGKLDFRGAEDFMNRLRRNPNVQYVEIDRILKPSFIPNDTYYPNQWHYYEAIGGINMPAAWAQATGAGVVVAVLDTGITAHSDLDANIVAGYDFIRRLIPANDGNGRDSDPSDPGDWVAVDECGVGEAAADSTWHGTHVSGTIAAVTNNAKGVAGVAFNAKVMPVRVLGKCGGSTSDISDAIYWVAGSPIVGVPTNSNPVEVINLSLGGAGSCSASTQAAIDYAVAAGVVVVVAAGNDNADASSYEPANCNNVVVVGATQRAGARSSYSNFGSAVDVAAPGGGDGNYVRSTFNLGKTVPTTEAYAGYQGTSMATPHVAGVAALMQSTSVTSPVNVEAVLKSTARALPVTCPEGCGAGIINASSAVGAVGSGALTVADVSTTEGNTGTKSLSFTVSLSKPMLTDVTFDVATANGSATAGSDYVALALNAQSIAAGVTSKTFNVTINGDTTVEPNETFTFNVSNVTGILVANGQGIGTIINDDATALANGVAVNGITSAVGTYLIYSLEVPAGRTSVTFTTSGGTGDADLFVKLGAIPSSTNADCKSEGATTAENCVINSPAAGTYYVVVLAYSAISGVSLVGTYVPDATPTLSVSDASVTEGAAGTKLLGFTVNLTSASANAVTFDLATYPGTAIPGVDYAPSSAVGVSIPAGQTSANFNVTINGDTEIEDNETFTVDASNINGALAGNVQGLGRIINDDQAQLRIADASIIEGNNGLSTLVFDVVLSQPMPSPVTFDIATSNGTATAGSDYVARSQAGRYLDAGRSRVQFEVIVNGDASAEPDETINVTVSNVNGALLADGAAVGTIINDDGPGFVAGGTLSAQSVLVSPVLLGFDGKPIVDEAVACRPAGQRRGRLEPKLPTCARGDNAAGHSAQR